MNLLIVDDEYYNVENIRNIVQQNRPEIDPIYCTYNLHHALDYFSQNEIHIMICDIEMPGGSGLELLDRIRNMKQDTICIFLTAYATFEYVSTAMKLSSSDYLLKPIEDSELLVSVDKAIAQYHHHKQNALNTIQAEYWKESELYLTEAFWLDLLAGTINQNTIDIERELNYRKLNSTMLSTSFFLLLIQGNPDSQTLLDHSLYEFTLKNIVREYFYHKEELPVTLRLTKELYLLPLPAAERTQSEIVRQCEAALQDFVPHFPNSFNFYVAGEQCSMAEAETIYQHILKTTRKNVSLENHVFDLSKPFLSNYDVEDQPFPMKRWTDLLLQNKTESLADEAQGYLKQLQHSGHATRKTLTAFYYSFLQLLFGRMNENQPKAQQLFHDNLSQYSMDQICSSIHELKAWVPEILTIYTSCLSNTESYSAAVTKVISYIRTHLYEDMNRNTLAAGVYLNPDYLSHTFKNETGQSLINFIIEERIAEAKRLLTQNEMSIRDIAITCGFQNISYFSRQFKKSTGITPREFRG